MPLQGVHLTNMMTYSVVAFQYDLLPQLQIHIICLLNYRLTTTKLQINNNNNNNNYNNIKSNLQTHVQFSRIHIHLITVLSLLHCNV